MAFSIPERYTNGGVFLIYGEEGTGKTNLGLHFPLPIFFRAEVGTNVPGVIYSDFTTYEEFYHDLDQLHQSDDMYGKKTIVIDTINSLENLMHDYFCRRNNAKTLPEYGGKSMGGAYVWREAMLPDWDKLTKKLYEIRQKFECNIVIIGHEVLRNIKPHDGEEYKKKDVGLINPLAANKMRQFADVTCFIHRKVLTRNTTGNEKMKHNIAVGGKDLLFGLTENGTYYAKCRDFDGRVATENIDVVPYQDKNNPEFLAIFDHVIAK